MSKEVIHTESAPHPPGDYSQAWLVSESKLIFVSGQVYIRKAGEIRREYFPQDFPSAILVQVKSLAHPEFMVEIEATAAVG